MELLLKILGVCAVGAVLSLLLRSQKQVLSICVITAVVIVVLPTLLNCVNEIFDFFDTLVRVSGLSAHVFTPMLKVTGIAVVTKIGTSFCKEAESDTASALLEIGGTCCALMASLPLMTKVLDMLRDMM